MRLQSLLFAAAAGVHVASADFLVITEAIIPTTLVPQFSNIQQVCLLEALSLTCGPECPQLTLGRPHSGLLPFSTLRIRSVF